jgi:acylphosphatase
MIQAVHAIAEGRVQGVGYRWFVQKTATKFGIKGYVRNLPDGTVEIEAEGEQESLAIFIIELKKGPLGSHVQDLKLHRKIVGSDAERRFNTFEILQ